MPDDLSSSKALTWDEIVDHCSRLHTTRRKPRYRCDDDCTEMREASEMLDVLIDTGGSRGISPAQIVPTQMHEPGFYWRWMDGEFGPLRSPLDLRVLRDMVEGGHVYLAPARATQIVNEQVEGTTT